MDADIATLESGEQKLVAGAIPFSTMADLLTFTNLMAESGPAVPPHLRDQPGACLAIATKALRFGFDPFTLAEHSFLTTKGFGTEQVETIAYDSFVIRSIINAHAQNTGALAYSYSGEGADRTCTVTATPEGGETRSLTSPPLGALIAMRMQDGVLRGSVLWETKPDQQMGYDTARDFCRLHHPEILMGWYDKDELTAKRAPKPKPQVGARLKGAKGDGFSADGVAKALEPITPPVRLGAATAAIALTGPRKPAKRSKKAKLSGTGKGRASVVSVARTPGVLTIALAPSPAAPLRSEF